MSNPMRDIAAEVRALIDLQRDFPAMAITVEDWGSDHVAVWCARARDGGHPWLLASDDPERLRKELATA